MGENGEDGTTERLIIRAVVEMQDAYRCMNAAIQGTITQIIWVNCSRRPADRNDTGMLVG